MFKFTQLLQDDFLVHTGHMMDAMLQHMGTTSGPFSTGQIVAFWDEFSIEDSVRFYYFYLTI